jgi:four helix bundle protein
LPRSACGSSSRSEKRGARFGPLFVFEDTAEEVREETEVGGRRSEVREETEVGGRKSGKRQKSEVRGRKSAKRQKSEVEREACMSADNEDKRIKSGKDLKVYKRAYRLAMQIFEVSKGWPIEERYSLTDQVRRSSRSVCNNLREAWAKRRYEAYFISKLTDADGENAETDTWLDFAKGCEYLQAEDHQRLTSECVEIGSMLGSMMRSSAGFIINE